jgi:hypothetical protein
MTKLQSRHPSSLPFGDCVATRSREEITSRTWTV